MSDYVIKFTLPRHEPEIVLRQMLKTMKRCYRLKAEVVTGRLEDEATVLIQAGHHASELVICSHPDGYQHMRYVSACPCPKRGSP